mgnify:CR=1 FL=1
MTKAELVEMIAAETGISKKDTGIIVNLILENIGRALVSSDKVELRGFGSFKVKTRRARLAKSVQSAPAWKFPLYFRTIGLWTPFPQPTAEVAELVDALASGVSEH